MPRSSAPPGDKQVPCSTLLGCLCLWDFCQFTFTLQSPSGSGQACLSTCGTLCPSHILCKPSARRELCRHWGTICFYLLINCSGSPKHIKSCLVEGVPYLWTLPLHVPVLVLFSRPAFTTWLRDRDASWLGEQPLEPHWPQSNPSVYLCSLSV